MLRHVTSINDLSLDEIEGLFSLADRYLAELGDKTIPYRIARSTQSLPGSILASLFYEPSTRTRLSFESAMLRLGGKTISSADPRTSSAAKGESLADTIRVVSNYADVIVVRHPRDGAAKLAAKFATIPIINGGDGSHEHPTQTLCDLYTLRRKNRSKSLKNLKIAISGDLKGSRTIHSFVYALARFGAEIIPKPAPGMDLPPHVDWRLRHEFHMVKRDDDDVSVDALYVTADQPHQLSLYAPASETKIRKKSKKGIDAIYVTRFQSERWQQAADQYPKVDVEFLRDNKYKRASVMHPLPRVGELDISLDQDRRAAYFEQASYGVPIRMALISALVGAKLDFSLEQYAGGFAGTHAETYEERDPEGISCANPNCIVHDAFDSAYAEKLFHVMNVPPRLRCYYCETDIPAFVVGWKKSKTFQSNTEVSREQIVRRARDLTIFADAATAEVSGYAPLTDRVGRRVSSP